MPPEGAAFWRFRTPDVPVARTPKPWFREDHGEYFVTVRGVCHRLGPDRADADCRFHALMAAAPTAVLPSTAARAGRGGGV